MQNRIFKPRSGFTLIELLVVIAIIGLLSTVALTNLNASRVRARDIEKINDLKQIEKALQLYEADHDQLPPVGGNIWWDDGNRSNNNDMVDFLGKYMNNDVPRDPGGNGVFYYCRDTVPRLGMPPYDVVNKDMYLLAVTLEQNRIIDGDIDLTINMNRYFGGVGSDECISSVRPSMPWGDHQGSTPSNCNDSNAGRITVDAEYFPNRTVFCLGYRG